MIFQINPLSDRRWGPFVDRHPSSSIFHTAGWLEALRRTYGYEPVVYTTSPPREDLANGLVFCRVSSWLTGKRLVSVPFSDHCDPLLGGGISDLVLFDELRRAQKSQGLKYIEIRPRKEVLDEQSGMKPGKSYCFHALDLRFDESKLFSGLHKECTQRKVKRAEKAKMKYLEGHSDELLRMFYHMFIRSRRRQRTVPQPFRWFQNLSACLGPAMQVRVALNGEQLAASIVTLRFRDTLVYKYGCSDPKLRNLGATQWLFWKSIQEAKSLGLHELDLGRSDWDNPGLIVFKDRLGGKRSRLSYQQYPNADTQPYRPGILWRSAGTMVGLTPVPILVVAGRLLYRHVG